MKGNNINKDLLQNLLVPAFEGGSNYWYKILQHNKKEIPECKFVSELLSFEQGKMLISDSENQIPESGKWITNHDVVNAWNKFTTDHEYREHYGDLLKGNEDAITGDVFLQLVVFDKVIYG